MCKSDTLIIHSHYSLEPLPELSSRVRQSRSRSPWFALSPYPPGSPQGRHPSWWEPVQGPLSSGGWRGLSSPGPPEPAPLPCSLKRKGRQRGPGTQRVPTSPAQSSFHNRWTKKDLLVSLRLILGVSFKSQTDLSRKDITGSCKQNNPRIHIRQGWIQGLRRCLYHPISCHLDSVLLRIGLVLRQPMVAGSPKLQPPRFGVSGKNAASL